MLTKLFHQVILDILRIIETPILNNIFKYAPRNRLFNTNTSKHEKEGQNFCEDSNLGKLIFVKSLSFFPLTKLESPLQYNNQDLETKESHSSVSNNSFIKENGENRKNMELLFSSSITFDSFYPGIKLFKLNR